MRIRQKIFECLRCRQFFKHSVCPRCGVKCIPINESLEELKAYNKRR